MKKRICSSDSAPPSRLVRMTSRMSVGHGRSRPRASGRGVRRRPGSHSRHRPLVRPAVGPPASNSSWRQRPQRRQVAARRGSAHRHRHQPPAAAPRAAPRRARTRRTASGRTRRSRRCSPTTTRPSSDQPGRADREARVGRRRPAGRDLGAAARSAPSRPARAPPSARTAVRLAVGGRRAGPADQPGHHEERDDVGSHQQELRRDRRVEQRPAGSGAPRRSRTPGRRRARRPGASARRSGRRGR